MKYLNVHRSLSRQSIRTVRVVRLLRRCLLLRLRNVLCVRCINAMTSFHMFVVIRPIGEVMLTVQTTVRPLAGVLSSVGLE